MRLRRAIATAAACTVALIAAAPAAGANNPIVQDCLQHRAGLQGHYSVSALRHALQVIPQASQEYTSCPDVINRALLAAVKVSKHHDGGGGSGLFLPVPVLIVLAVLVVAAAGFGAMALRNRRRAPDA